MRVENTSSPFVAGCRQNQVLHIPISHYEGCYYADEANIAELETNGQIVLRYCDPVGNITEAANPNGSLGNIAGITNKAGNVLGMMPHPERCCEEMLGGTDGQMFFLNIINTLTT